MEDKLIDADVLSELKGRMKENCVMPDGDTVLRSAPDFLDPDAYKSHLCPGFTEITKLDPADYATCLCPSFRATSVMPEPLVDKESFREFMDELIKYVEDPTPIQATWVKALQRKYNIGVFMTDYPKQFSYRVSITIQCGMWKIDQWDEFVPYDVADIIMKAVDYL